MRYQNTRGAGFRDWSSNGGVIISTRFGEVSQLHHVAKPGGARKQITFYTEPIGGTSVSPGGFPGFVFSKDTGGNENYHLYSFNESNGGVIALTKGESRNEGPVWSKDGSKIAFRSNARDGKNWDIYTTTPDGAQEPKRVFEGNSQWWGAVGFSHDGSKLIVSKYISAADSEFYIVDLATGEATLIQEDGQRASYYPVGFTRDDGGIYFVSNVGTEFSTLRLYDLETGAVTHLTSDINWNIEGVDLSPDGKKMVFTVNANGQSQVYIRKTKNNKDLAVPDLPPGIVRGVTFSPDGKDIAFTFYQATSPGDVYTYNLWRKKLTRWTESELGGLDTSTFVTPELVTFKSFDDLEVSAYYYKPKCEGPHPVVVSIHGGPEGQSRPYYSSTYQYWLKELCAAVLVPNVRGSRGYGKTFISLDNGYKREDSVKDIGALLDWIEGQSDLDKEKVVVYGGSYGGYMVLASLVHYNDRLAGGVDVVGISNFVTFLENTAPYRKDVRRPEYGDERDPEMRAFLEKISPLNNAKAITKPLFIIQGLNDPRVPASEADQMKEIVRSNGGEVWYLGAKDEGHGFRKKKNRDFQTAAQTLFLKELFEE